MRDICKRLGCESESRVRSPYCSNACKQADFRLGVTELSVTPDVKPTVILTDVTLEKSKAVGKVLHVPILALESKANPEQYNQVLEKEHINLSHGGTIVLSLQHYQDNPDLYHPRSEPELLNWGKWMNTEDLKKNGFKANRVPIPGDFDYVGMAV